MAIEDAYLYLNEKYPGVEFDFSELNLAGLMGTQSIIFYPTGSDKEDDRNLVTIYKERRRHEYTDNYMLVAVREQVQNVVTKYVEDYFGKGNVKVKVYPAKTDIQFGEEINEHEVSEKVESTAVLFVPSDSCSEEQLDKFSENYKKDNHGFICEFRATIVSREDFDKTTVKNLCDLYKADHIIYDIMIDELKEK